MMKGRCLCWIRIVIWWLTSTYLQSLSIATATAILRTQWNNNDQGSLFSPSHRFQDSSSVRPVLHTETYGCGFYGNETFRDYFFAVFILDSRCYDFLDSIVFSSACYPQVVWSGDRNSPVKINSTLELKSDGDLVLRGADGTIAWSTNTSGKSVVGMNLTELGNLVLFDDKNRIIWQSFDHPTDSLVLGQKLKVDQKLIPSVSSTNLAEMGLLSLSMTREYGLLARLETNPPQAYYQSVSDTFKSTMAYVQFSNGGLSFIKTDNFVIRRVRRLLLPETIYAQYMKFSSDGHLRLYEFRDNVQWEEISNVLTEKFGECGYPTVCGEYGICSSKGQCNCPTSGDKTDYFNRINERQPELGCSAVTPLTCEASHYHSYLELQGVTHIGSIGEYQKDLSREGCKEVCFNNCSCKAAFYHVTSSSGQSLCFLTTQVFSLMYRGTDQDIVTYVKVQNFSVKRSRRPSVPVILGIVGAAVSSLLVLSGVLVFFIMKKEDSNNEVEEDYLDQVPGMPKRFLYDNLKAFTGDFSKKLGQGGFGSVFEGSLLDSTKVAVKWLRGLGQIESSFLAEVKTIGSIHHVNLVKLVGFCAEKSHRLLVYEYMANGSLDRWIFYKKNELVLTWERRKMVIIDIAKGLNYLHQECRQKILHLDIKPQNILLNENFNAKVSDFGLSKLIERDQSQVMTMMRGTPGYLAPEWLSSIITEKVDVYSFGVVVLEIVCGRKVFDSSEDEDDQYLLSLFKRKAEEGRLIDIVGNYGYQVQLHGLDAVNMMNLAAWCLQANYKKRPSMSVVVKVLEGVMTVQEEEELDYNFWITPTELDRRQNNVIHATPPPLPSVLSAPR